MAFARITSIFELNTPKLTFPPSFINFSSGGPFPPFSAWSIRGFLYWVTKKSQYFDNTFFQTSLNFWLSFTSCFSQDKLIGSGMLLFCWLYLGSVLQESIVMIIKHLHTYTHCTFRLYINTHKLSSIFP